MPTREELVRAFIKADDAGNTEDAQVFADAIRKMDASGGAAPQARPRQSVDGEEGVISSTLRNLNLGVGSSLAALDDTGAKAIELLDSGLNAVLPGEQEPGMLAGAAGMFRDRAAEIRAMVDERTLAGDDSFGARAAQTVGALPVSALKAAPAVALGGPIAGMAAMGALEAKDEGPAAILREAAVGGASGLLFPLTRELGPLARAATVGGGTAGIELAAGRTPQDAVLSGLVSGALTPLDAPPRRANRSDVPRGVENQNSPTLNSNSPSTTQPRGTPKSKLVLNRDSDFDFPITDAKGNVVGNIFGEARVQDGQPVLRVRNAGIDVEAARGQGNAVRAYDELAREGRAQGRDLLSDSEVTPDVVRVYEALERRGYTVERHPEAVPKPEGGGLYVPGKANAPVFRVKAGQSDAFDYLIRRMEGEPKPSEPRVAVDEKPVVEVLRRTRTPGMEERASELVRADFSDIELGDTTVNINNRKINGPDDLKLVVQTVAGLIPERLEDARGVTTIAQIQKLARAAGLDENATRLLTRKKGEAFNAKELQGARYVLGRATAELEEMSNRIYLGKATDVDKADFLQSYGVFEMILEKYVGAVAEAGRTLRILREPVSVSNVNAKMLKLFPALNKLPNGEDPARALAELVRTARTTGDLSRGLRKAREATTMDALLEGYTNMLLSGPQTAVVNPVSNSLVVAQGIAEQYGAAAQGIFRKGTDKVTFGEANAHLFGAGQAAKDMLIGFGRAFLARDFKKIGAILDDGLEDAPGPIETRQGAIAQVAQRAKEQGGLAGLVGGGVGKIEPGLTVFSRMLSRQDQFFKQIAKRQSLNMQAYREAASKGLRGEERANFIADFIRNPPESAMGKARSYALKQTFQAPLGEFGSKISAAIQSNPGARIIVPFVRTPMNIFKYAVERTPAGVFLKEVRDDLRGKNGQAAADLARARIAMSTAAVTAVASWVADGTLQGAGPRNPESRRVWLEAGNRPYSWRYNGERYQFGRLEPVGTLLGIAADAAEIMGETEEVTADELAATVVTAFMRNMGQKTFLQGMTSVANAITDPERYGGNFVQRLAGSLVPTGVAQVARTQDPIVRDAQTMLDKIKSRIPGKSETLPPRIGVWGDPIVLDPGVGPDLISPLFHSPVETDRTKTEAARLKAALTLPRRNEWGIELTPQEYAGLAKIAGQKAKQLVDSYVKSDAYESTPTDAIRRTQIEKLYNTGKNVGKAMFLGELAARDPIRFRDAKIAQAEEKTGFDLQ